MTITSSAFQNNAPIPSKYTCDGEDILPPLSISGVPIDAKSLAIIVDDPDAPVGTWVHWVVYNIDPKTTEIRQGFVLSNSVEGKNSAGTNAFHGPCPPSGTHRYFFKLYALDCLLEKNEDVTKQELEEKIKNHILAFAELIGFYKRK